MFVVISFFVLIGVSLLAWICEKRRPEGGFLLFTFKCVPALCAGMGALFILFVVILVLLAKIASPAISYLNCPKVFSALFEGVFCLGALLILVGGIAVHLAFAGRRNFSLWKALGSFALGFTFSAAVTAAVFAAHTWFVLNTWSGVEIHPEYSCKMLFKRLPAMCPEFDRYVGFDSGRKIGIHTDTCGLSDFEVYDLGEGRLYLRCMRDFGSSYIIDDKNEKVYEESGGKAIELKGDMIEGRSIDARKATYYTYTRTKDKKGKSYESPVEDWSGILAKRKLVGKFGRYGFSKI